MIFQEGTVVTAYTSPPKIYKGLQKTSVRTHLHNQKEQTLSGVVITSKKIETEEDREFEVFKVMFQNENKNVGTYVWCSENRNFGALHGTTPVAESAELIYAGENHRDCPIEVRKA